MWFNNLAVRNGHRNVRFDLWKTDFRIKSRSAVIIAYRNTVKPGAEEIKDLRTIGSKH